MHSECRTGYNSAGGEHRRWSWSLDHVHTADMADHAADQLGVLQ